MTGPGGIAAGVRREALSPEEVTGHLGVPVKTLFQWRYRGGGASGLRVGRYLRYRAEDVEAWLERVGDRNRRGEVA